MKSVILEAWITQTGKFETVPRLDGLGFMRSVDNIPLLGEPVHNWSACNMPPLAAMTGRTVELLPLNTEEHAQELFAAYDGHDQVWDFLPYGPFPDVAGYKHWAAGATALSDHRFYAIRTFQTNRVLGVASYLRIMPQNGSIEVGHLNFSPALQKTIAATEAMFLMMNWAFEAGYRRYEWKCDALNIPSRRAAQRLGFSFEGIFRQATVAKGRNRDTAWFAIIDTEWPALKNAFELWLSDPNFKDGEPIRRLSDLTAPILAARDPVL